MESILLSIKKLLGIQKEFQAFDADIIMHINSVFTILTQLGVGPENGFMIYDERDTWEDFVGDDPRLSSVKSYTYLQVRLLFDPPAASSAIESANRMIQELEWRLNATVDFKGEN